MRRVIVTFWIAVRIAILAMGALSRALSAPPSPTAGLTVAASGLVLAVTVALAVRILWRMERR